MHRHFTKIKIYFTGYITKVIIARTNSNILGVLWILQNLLTSVVERTPKIEKVNVDGGRFIREAKVTIRC